MGYFLRFDILNKLDVNKMQHWSKMKKKIALRKWKLIMFFEIQNTNLDHLKYRRVCIFAAI